jgi:hypothetical protein
MMVSIYAVEPDLISRNKCSLSLQSVKYLVGSINLKSLLGTSSSDYYITFNMQFFTDTYKPTTSPTISRSTHVDHQCCILLLNAYFEFF